jgi:hypothetical protein
VPDAGRERRIELVAYVSPESIRDTRRASDHCRLTHLSYEAGNVDATARLVELGGKLLERTEVTGQFGDSRQRLVLRLGPDGSATLELRYRP